MSPSSSTDFTPPAYLPGEVWWVSFDPAVGPEIKKVRPAVVVSAPHTLELDVRVVVPIRERKDWHARFSLLIPIDPSPTNGVTKDGSADTSQMKSVSRVDRFKGFRGRLSPEDLAEVYAGIRLCLGLTDAG